MKQRIENAGGLRGSLSVPGDKSISHRALIMGCIAREGVLVTGASDAADVRSTEECLRRLGCTIDRTGGGIAVSRPHSPASASLNAGNSGTTARLLCGVIAGLGIDCTIDGDDSLRRRPMARIAVPLRHMNADIELSQGDTLPLRIRGGRLRGHRHELSVASAQVKSAILLAGLFCPGATSVVEPVPTRDHTERMLSRLGVAVTRIGNEITVEGGQLPRGGNIAVPGDFSSAAYFLIAASVVTGSEVTIRGVGINPTRTGLLLVLESMGADIELNNIDELSGEPVADIVVRSAPLHGVTIDDPALVASIIDEIPVMAVASAMARGKTVIRNAGELRHKESDRIATTAAMLRALGARVETTDDGLVIHGGSLGGAAITSEGDHRIAMAAAVAGMAAQGETVVVGSEAADISYPSFYDDLKSLATGKE